MVTGKTSKINRFAKRRLFVIAWFQHSIKMFHSKTLFLEFLDLFYFSFIAQSTDRNSLSVGNVLGIISSTIVFLIFFTFFPSWLYFMLCWPREKGSFLVLYRTYNSNYIYVKNLMLKYEDFAHLLLRGKEIMQFLDMVFIF